MAKTCATCGSPLDDKAKFCTVCGTPVPVQTIGQERYCVQCGNLLKAGTKFCEVCGREVAAPKVKEQPTIVEPTTMDELVIPEITEDTFASSRDKMYGEKFDGFEAAVMPDSQPTQPTAPPPTPEFSMDSAMADKEKPKQTVTVKPKPVIPQSMPQQPTQQAAPQQNMQYGQQPNVNPYPNPGMPIPTVGADGKEKKSSPVVPIILAALIVLVLVADAVIFLGKKDDTAEKDVALIADTYSVSVQTDAE